jgi:hypothetical protein
MLYPRKAKEIFCKKAVTFVGNLGLLLNIVEVFLLFLIFFKV